MDAFLANLQQYTSILRDIVSIASGIVLAVIAYAGLRIWRSQLKGKTEYELARRLLRAVYRVREAVRGVRLPFISAAESNSAIQEDEIDISALQPTQRAKSLRAVYRRRWKAVSQLMANLDVEALEAEAIWGTPVREAMLPLRQSISRLLSDLDSYLDWKEDPDRYPLEDEKGTKIEETIFDIYYLTDGESENQFTAQLARSIGEIEAILRPRLRL